MNDAEIGQTGNRIKGAPSVNAYGKCWVSLFGALGSIFLAAAIGGQSSLFAQAPNPVTRPQTLGAHVPFVGCKSDGQVGPLDAPIGSSKLAPVFAESAERLAYYKAEQGIGVLAPRGWYCFGTYGSNGSILYISPEPINAAGLFSTNWKGFTGPVIQFASLIGDTSGRFEVAQTIARVFPAHRGFVKKVIAEGIEPASSFPFGPYPKDKLTYRSNEIVEYQTPPETDGLGTTSMLQKNASPICGVAILWGQELDLLFLAARLPPNLVDLTPAIVDQVKRDAMHPSP